jgi:putative transposase
MRYADGGGLTEQGRAKREAVRLQAAEWFAQDMPVAEIACRLRVTTNAVYVWRRQWRAGGSVALASKGSGGSACQLDEPRQTRFAQALEQGPAAHGFDKDQRWTLARVADLIARLFHIRYSLRGVSYLLHRMGSRHRFRHTGRSNGTRTSSPRGGGRRGQRENDSGGAGCLAVL